MLDTSQKGFDKLISMIGALEVGMLTTANADGVLRSRPMATQKTTDGKLYFFTSKTSLKVEGAGADASVNVSYADPGNQTYVSVSGRARISRGKNKIREIWTESARRWFPQGPDDERLAVLEVDITKADFWDIDAQTMVELLNREASGDEIVAATDHRKLS